MKRGEGKMEMERGRGEIEREKGKETERKKKIEGEEVIMLITISPKLQSIYHRRKCDI